jgi:rod shape-determining protein MreC
MVMMQEQAELSRRAFLDHQRIESQRDSVTVNALNSREIAEENTRLRLLVGLGSRLKWGFIPVEALHSRGVRDETGMTLSAGSRAGIKRLSPVVAPEGLVGVVDNVDPTMSHAMLWTHPDFRVSAMSVDGSAFGIVQAHVANGPGKYLMEMRGVPFRTSIKPGTMIVSSGLGGVYPRGIPLGHVIGETKTSESWALTYLIRPAVFPSDVYSVMILKPERAAQGVDNVWAVGNIADTTVQKIVSAGDSMARAAALAEARARQAAHDSLVRDSLRRAGLLEPANVPGVQTVPGQAAPGQSVTPPSRQNVSPSPKPVSPDTATRTRRPATTRPSIPAESTHRDSVRRRGDTAPSPNTI